MQLSVAFRLSIGIIFLFFFLPIATYGQTWKAISVGDFYTLAIKDDGTLWSCGKNDEHQLGRIDQPDGYIYQTGTSNDWESVAASYNYSAGIKKDSTLWVWGAQVAIGIGNLGTYLTTPIQFDSLHNWRKVTTGYYNTLAIKSDSTLWGFGDNSYGQLGDGTYLSKTIPAKIGNASNWKDVQCGTGTTLAIKSDGSLWAWGDNSYGQLGDGTFVSQGKNFPLQIGASHDWQSISTTGQHVVAIKKDSTLWAWGANMNYALGDGTTTWGNAPIQISASHDWQSISAGGGYTLAIKVDGSLWGWGYNGSYQLGNGTNADVIVPTQIGNAYDWKEVNARNSHSLALKNDNSLWGWGDGSYNNLVCPFLSIVPVPVELDCVFTSVDNLLPATSIEIYPNPARERLYIKVPEEMEIKYKISNPLALLISTEQTKNSTEAIDISNLKPGLYVITIKTAKGQATKQFVEM